MDRTKKIALAADLLHDAMNVFPSRYALAQATGIDEGNLSKLAHGQRIIGIKTIVKICDATGLDPTQYLGRFMELESTSYGMFDRENTSPD